MEKIIEKFYIAFQNKDYESMVECYHENVSFEDPVFGELSSVKAKAMWRMLCEKAKDLEISFSDIQTSGDRASVKWEAVYTYAANGNKIHNKIKAEFIFKDGKIISHKDNFDLYAWLRMALGLPGIFLGWLPSVQAKTRDEAAKGLMMYMKRKRIKE